MKKYLILFFGLVIFSGCELLSSPNAAYKKITEYASKKDFGAVYDNIDEYSKGQLDVSLKMLASFASAFSEEDEKKEIDNLSGRDLFIKIVGSEEGTKETIFIPKTSYKIIKAERRGREATLTIKHSNGDLVESQMIYEGGKWKLRLEAEGQEENTTSTKKKKLTLTEKAEAAKQEKLAKEIQEKEDAEKARLRQVVTMALVEKSFVGSDPMSGRYQDYITLKVAIENNSDKDVKALKGVLIFKDIFGDEIIEVNFKYDEGIKALSRTTWEGGIDYNQFNDSHQRLRDIELKNLSLQWEPQTIIFEDETTENKQVMDEETLGTVGRLKSGFEKFNNLKGKN